MGIYEDQLRLANEAMTKANAGRRQQELLGELRSAQTAVPGISPMEADLARGAAYGQQYFAPGAFGRLDTATDPRLQALTLARQKDISSYGRSGDIQDVLARRRANLQGMTPEELTAQRESTIPQILQQQQGQQRLLASQLAAQGVRGPAAIAQLRTAQQSAGKQMTDNERNLYLQNLAMRREALGGFEGSARAAEGEDFSRTQAMKAALEGLTQKQVADEQERQKFNLLQQQQELGQRLASQLGFAQIGSAERTGSAQADIARKALEFAQLQTQRNYG